MERSMTSRGRPAAQYDVLRNCSMSATSSRARSVDTSMSGGSIQSQMLSHSYNRAVRVAIDARKLHDFGIGTYIRNLLRHLARLDTRTEYVLLCHEPDMGAAAQLGPNFRTVLEPSPNYSIREQIHVPWVLLRERPDVFHSPHYVLPPAVR